MLEREVRRGQTPPDRFAIDLTAACQQGGVPPTFRLYSVIPSIRRARTRLPLTSPAFNFDNALSAIARSTAT